MTKLPPIPSIIVLGLALLLLPTGALAQTYLIDTGPGGNTFPAPSLFFNTTNGSFQSLAGQFTLTSGAVVDSVEGWVGPCFCGGGTLEVKIRADASGLPGNSLFSKTYAL